ncbi:MAG: hypothetical protein RL386_2109 [Bacteroidota bacterium]
MDSWQYFFPIEPGRSDLLLAWLEGFPFDAFQETEAGLYAFLPADVGPEALSAELDPLLRTLGITCERTLIPAQNWNALWESNFSPVQVGTFCGIRADFHLPLRDVRHELVIQPKMAFGTGHHETTYMMIAFMETMHLQNARVLDFGCGTGILAILAAKLGAFHVDAVDIEDAAVENTIENAAINGVSGQITAFTGSLEAVPEQPCDIILANINRNVILATLPSLFKRLCSGGNLLISGILERDRAHVLEAAQDAGFQVNRFTGRGNWVAASLLRP